MHSSGSSLGSTGADELIARKPDSEPPEFDITAMVDLVFMMNIYFLVTFVTVAMGEMNLPAADHCSPLNPDEAITIAVTRSLDGESIVVHLGEGDNEEKVTDPAQQEQKVLAAVEQATAEGKFKVLLKCEKKVRMADMFRVANAATAATADRDEKVKLYDGVVEKDTE